MTSALAIRNSILPPLSSPLTSPSQKGLRGPSETYINQRLASEDKRLGKSINNGDCFFTSLADGLNRSKNTNFYSARELRQIEANKIDSNDRDILEFIDGYHNEGGLYNTQKLNFLEYIGLDNDKVMSTERSAPIWGEPRRDLRILCEELAIKVRILAHENLPDDPDFFSDRLFYFDADTKTLKETEFNPELITPNDLLVEIAGDGHHFVPVINYTPTPPSSPIRQFLSLPANDNGNPSNTLTLTFPSGAPLRLSPDGTSIDMNSIINCLDDAGKMKWYTVLAKTLAPYPSAVRNLKDQLNLRENRRILKFECEAHEKQLALINTQLDKLRSAIEADEKALAKGYRKGQPTGSYRRAEKRLNKLYEQENDLLASQLQLASLDPKKAEKELDKISATKIVEYFRMMPDIAFLNPSKEAIEEFFDKFHELKRLDPTSLVPYIPLLTILAGNFNEKSLREIVLEATRINPHQTFAYIWYAAFMKQELVDILQSYDKDLMLKILSEMYPKDILIRTIKSRKAKGPIDIRLINGPLSKSVQAIVEGNYDLAISQLAEQTRTQFSFAYPYRYLALAWMLKGDKAKALEMQEKASWLPSPRYLMQSIKAFNGFVNMMAVAFKKKFPVLEATPDEKLLSSVLNLLEPKEDLDLEVVKEFINTAIETLKPPFTEFPLLYIGVRHLSSKLFIGNKNFATLRPYFLSLFDLMNTVHQWIDEKDESMEETFKDEDDGSMVVSFERYPSGLEPSLPKIEFESIGLTPESGNSVAVSIVKELHGIVMALLLSEAFCDFLSTSEMLPQCDNALLFKSLLYRGFNEQSNVNGEPSVSMHHAKSWFDDYLLSRPFPIDPDFLSWATFCVKSLFPNPAEGLQFRQFIDKLHTLDKLLGKDDHIARLAFQDANQVVQTPPEDSKFPEKIDDLFQIAQGRYLWKPTETFEEWGERLQNDKSIKIDTVISSKKNDVFLDSFHRFWTEFHLFTEQKNEHIENGGTEDGDTASNWGKDIDLQLWTSIIKNNQPKKYPGYSRLNEDQQRALDQIIEKKHEHANQVESLKKAPIDDPVIAAATLLWLSEFPRKEKPPNIFVKDEATARQVHQILLKVAAERTFRRIIIAGTPSMSIDNENTNSALQTGFKELIGKFHGPETHVTGTASLQWHYNAAAINSSGTSVNTHIYFNP